MDKQESGIEFAKKSFEELVNRLPSGVNEPLVRIFKKIMAAQDYRVITNGVFITLSVHFASPNDEKVISDAIEIMEDILTKQQAEDKEKAAYKG